MNGFLRICLNIITQIGPYFVVPVSYTHLAAMTRLTKIEKETIVLFNEGEDKANIYTHNAGLKKRLAAFAKKYPDLCRLEKSNVQGGVSYELAKSRLSIRFLPPYSEERRQKASEYAKKHGLNSQQGQCDNQG